MSESASKAVFLSYASQDAEAARKIADALRAAGVEVWFDQSELRGGDSWDQKIRKQIKDCALFVPIISANTQARLEGYFRLEWKLAEDRSHLMAKGKTFIVPVTVDGTTEREAHVPDSFAAVQWTRIGSAESLHAFCERVEEMLSGPPSGGAKSREPAKTVRNFSKSASGDPHPPIARRKTVWIAAAAAVALLAIGFIGFRPKPVPPPVSSERQPLNAAPARAPLAPAKSVAVLAFENRSSERDSEYFSDGVSDELINVLGRVAGLKVVARTSSFAFKGSKAVSAQEIAGALGVAHLVEGSVQQVGGKARVIARLIQADTGEQLWGDSFDADVKDILSAQVTTARAIAQAMALRLNAASHVESLNRAAVQLYLQGRQEWGKRTIEAMRRAEDLFTRALALEPKFVRAHSGLVDTWTVLGQNDDSVGLFRERDSAGIRRIVERARLAVALDPDSAEAQASLGGALTEAWQLVEARRALERALALNPNYATAHQWLGRELLKEGLVAEAVTSLRRACELDPLSSRMADNLGITLWFMGRGLDGLAEIDRALVLQPDSEQAQAQRSMVLAGLGRRAEAIVQAREVLQRGGVRVMHAVCALAVAGQKDEAARIFASLPKPRGVTRSAHVLAALGRWEECLAALQPETMVPAAVDQMLFDAVFDPIRNDSRFIAVLETLGLREAHARAQAWRAANPPQTTKANQ